MSKLHDDLLEIARGYMGVAGEEYIRRRCKVSFGLESPQDIETGHLERLAESIGMTVSVYLNKEKAEQFKKDVLGLMNKTN